MSRNYRLYLEDIRTSADKVIRYTHGLDFEAFLADEKGHDAVVLNLQIIGEAVKNIPDEIKQRYPDVEWRKIAGLRDVIVHGYFGLEDETIWDIVQNKVPVLLTQVTRMLDEGF